MKKHGSLQSLSKTGSFNQDQIYLKTQKEKQDEMANGKVKEQGSQNSAVMYFNITEGNSDMHFSSVLAVNLKRVLFYQSLYCERSQILDFFPVSN